MRAWRSVFLIFDDSRGFEPACFWPLPRRVRCWVRLTGGFWGVVFSKAGSTQYLTARPVSIQAIAIGDLAVTLFAKRCAREVASWLFLSLLSFLPLILITLGGPLFPVNFFLNCTHTVTSRVLLPTILLARKGFLRMPLGSFF